MTLDAIDISITPPDFVRLLMGYSRRQEEVTIIVEDQDKNTVPEDVSVRCEICIDGSENGVAIHLRSDGTWQAWAPVILGEKS